MAKVLYFGNLPDPIGRGMEDLFLRKTVKTVRDLMGYLRARGKEWDAALQEDKLTVTVNKEFLDLDHAIDDSDEITLVPKGLGR